MRDTTAVKSHARPYELPPARVFSVLFSHPHLHVRFRVEGESTLIIEIPLREWCLAKDRVFEFHDVVDHGCSFAVAPL
jgi:hypothetical protein